MIIEFERANENDTQKLIDIQEKAFYLDFINYGEDTGIKVSYETMKNSIDLGYTFKIMVDDNIVGEITVREMGNKNYYLRSLCVIPEYENKGIGQKAMAFIDDYFTDAKSWSLETPADKLRNHYFYRKCGFEITDRIMDGAIEIVIFSKTKITEDEHKILEVI